MLNTIFGIVGYTLASIVGNAKLSCTNFKTWLTLQVPSVIAGVYAAIAFDLPRFIMVQYDASEQRTYHIAIGLTTYIVLSCVTVSLFAALKSAKKDKRQDCKYENVAYDNGNAAYDYSTNYSNVRYEEPMQPAQRINVTERKIVETFDRDGLPVRTIEEKVIEYA